MFTSPGTYEHQVNIDFAYQFVEEFVQQFVF